MIPKTTPLTTFSDSWSVQICGLETCPKEQRKFGLYYISGQSEVAGTDQTPMKDGFAPLVGLAKIGDQEARSYIWGDLNALEGYVFAVLDLRMKNRKKAGWRKRITVRNMA